MQVAAAYEEHAGADVRDVSSPQAARRDGLPDWPGFDLLARRPGSERRCIEVIFLRSRQSLTRTVARSAIIKAAE